MLKKTFLITYKNLTVLRYKAAYKICLSLSVYASEKFSYLFVCVNSVVIMIGSVGGLVVVYRSEGHVFRSHTHYLN